MRLPRLALAVMLFFFAGLVGASAGEVLGSSVGGDQVTHIEGSPCPDPDHSGDPCGPGCACTCCPGHAPAVAFAIPSLKLAQPPLSKLKVHPNEDLHPQDVLSRIFHPPRL